MKKNSRFDCLKDNEPSKKHKNKYSLHTPTSSAPAPTASAPTPTPRPTPRPTPTLSAPTPPPTPPPTPTSSTPAPQAKTWKELITETKNKDNDILKPKRGYVILYKNKMDNTIQRIVHPLDVEEELRHEQELEEERQREIYQEIRSRAIECFEYDLMMGNRNDFNSVEEYIEYLDKPIEESENEAEMQEEYINEYEDEYNEEYNEYN